MQLPSGSLCCGAERLQMKVGKASYKCGVPRPGALSGKVFFIISSCLRWDSLWSSTETAFTFFAGVIRQTGNVRVTDVVWVSGDSAFLVTSQLSLGSVCAHLHGVRSTPSPGGAASVGSWNYLMSIPA